MTAPDTAVLGVTRSLTGRRWMWRPGEDRIGLGIAQALGVPEIIGRLLAARGIGIAAAAHFLDPTLRAYRPALRGRRAVYLSTVGVYGDAGGAWVDEDSPTPALSPRARARVAAEAAWMTFGREAGVAVDILRLGGIYGPGRSAFDRLREGKARRVVKPGQVFNRIHVDDIAAAVETVASAGRPGAIYNVVDGDPSPPEAMIECAAALIGAPPPPHEPFASAGLTGMALSFYEENRRVRNARLRGLGWTPRYPSFREGLAAILAEEGARH